MKKIKHINDQIAIVDYTKAGKYAKDGYFPFLNHQNKLCHVLNKQEKHYQRNADRLTKSLDIIYTINTQEFWLLLDTTFSRFNIIKAKYHLPLISQSASAKNLPYQKIIVSFIIGIVCCAYFLGNFFFCINNIILYLQNILKATLLGRAIIDDTLVISYPAMQQEDLPCYTVLVPLYKELSKINSIITAMENLNYPVDKLDIKLILEEDDYVMVNFLNKLTLPNHFHIIKVPDSLPKTKPKAINYAMSYVRGKYLTIYDAEDIPDPDQLLKALLTFRSLPDNYACLQAKLNFYNHDENILTKFFSIEYNLWFGFLLKGLSILGLPVTLGGTSNHFKTHILEQIGYWDAYNVTEDADLGIRLYSYGYKVHILDSITLEESPITIKSWIQQRSRWVKGFIQTLCVFIRIRRKHNQITITQAICLYIFIGLSCYSFVCLPWLLLIICKPHNYYLNLIFLTNLLFAISYFYFSAIYILLVSRNKDLKAHDTHSNKQSIGMSMFIILTWPLYFLLHSIASYIALWESLVKPFKWNKTQHGMSNVPIPKL